MPASNQGDEPVGAGPGQAEGEYVDWIWIPGRLSPGCSTSRRLTSCTSCHSSIVYGRNSLTRDQVESLLDEIEFIARVVDDAALQPQLERLRDVALKVARNPIRTELVIEGP